MFETLMIALEVVALADALGGGEGRGLRQFLGLD
jgi:hypothetical protein